MKIIGFAGWSGSGKTTLLTKLIPLLVARGLKVSTLKHAHHSFDVDYPGKDSHSHRMAGASEVLVSSATRFALMHELLGSEEWTLGRLLGKFSTVDLVLIEGFKREKHPKIEVFRADNGKPSLHPSDDSIRAIASDCPFPQAGRPVIDLNDIHGIAEAALQLSVPAHPFVIPEA